ncbi:hypothetical protein ACQ4M3_22440 [Leptolyngbya sp. AN03gr2]|uniref:hypothetical protein n=1 Tax=unclassified Leptolyngbya TaxID=2650499 RepID=UPI003D31B601
MHDSIALTRCPVPMSVIHQFEQDPNAVRIQKLLFYVCRNRWESDSTRLDAANWRSLIEEVREKYSTIEGLRSRLAHQIGTLNKSAEYALIGQIILSVFERIYAQEAATEITTPKPLQIDQDVNVSRIKKLLIYTCRKYWEANSYIIEQTLTSELLNELMEQYATLEEVRSGLNIVVKTLNKPAEYAVVAESILHEVEPIYGTKNSHPVVEQIERVDLFNVRQEILKYANPLKAKILLFSSVYYSFEFCSQDWSNLKLYSLDGLLRTVLTQVETIEQFEQLLNEKASYLKEPETYLEIVPILVRSLKSNYTQLRQNLLTSLRTSSVADRTLASSTKPSL